MHLSRDDILKADDLETREVDVPEWGGTVLVRALSGTDRDAFEASMMQIIEGEAVPNLANRRAKLVARAVVDEDGNPLFNELDIGLLGQKSAAALERVFDVAAEMSGLAGEAVETAAGNSDAAERRFWFTLARDVFHCSVAEMLARVSSAELTEWAGFLQLEAEERDKAEKAQQRR